MLRKMVLGLAGLLLMLVVGVAIADDAKGKLKDVDTDKNTITVTVGDKDMKFMVKDAKFTAGKKDITIKDLKVGDNVSVTYDKDVASKVVKTKK
jgi:hypothetical protein